MVIFHGRNASVLEKNKIIQLKNLVFQEKKNSFFFDTPTNFFLCNRRKSLFEHVNEANSFHSFRINFIAFIFVFLEFFFFFHPTKREEKKT